MGDTSPGGRPWPRLLLPWSALLAITVGCQADPVCEDGVLETTLIMEDDEYFVAAGLDSQLPVESLGNAGVERCREIHGSVIFRGGISSFEDFDALEYGGETSRSWRWATRPKTSMATSRSS